jgi:hypothetical protein
MSGPAGAWDAAAIGLLRGLAALLRADFGYPACEAVPYLRESAGRLGLLGIGDLSDSTSSPRSGPRRQVSLLQRKWTGCASTNRSRN